ncbi:MAG: hypothetical protein N2560_01670 [Ignavibacteria bacterium]|nr:hypothetical protein [Ignavibacteria bacterium]
MKLTKEEQSIPPKKSGCSKNAHIFHFVFCFVLFLGVIQNINIKNAHPVDVILALYSIGGMFFSAIRLIKMSKLEKQMEVIKQFRELDSSVLTIAKINKGILTPSILSLHASVAIEEAKKILDSYVERGIASIEVTDEGTFRYIFPDFLEK